MEVWFRCCQLQFFLFLDDFLLESVPELVLFYHPLSSTIFILLNVDNQLFLLWQFFLPKLLFIQILLLDSSTKMDIFWLFCWAIFLVLFLVSAKNWMPWNNFFRNGVFLSSTFICQSNVFFVWTVDEKWKKNVENWQWFKKIINDYFVFFNGN